MKMTKKLAFIGWILGIIAMATFLPFGRDNMMVAMSSILLVPELIKEDYTVHKIKETLKLIIICLILSIAASLFIFNIYIGSILTLIIGFCVYYFYTYEDRESQSMIFMIYYILILSIPMKSLSQLPLRVGCTIYGAIVAMLLYFIIYRTNRSKASNKDMKRAMELLSNAIKKKKNNQIYFEDFKNSMSVFKEAEDKLIKNFEKTSVNKENLIEKEVTIDLIKNLAYLFDKESDKKVINRLEDIITKSYEFYNEIISIQEFEKILNDYRGLNYAEIESLKIKNLDSIILEFLVGYKKIKAEGGYLKNKKQLKSIIKKNSEEFNLNYKFYPRMNSIKFNLAIKGSLITAIAVFIVFYFNIPNGRWILYTITVTYLPFSEMGIKKLKDRIFGTILGFVVSIVVFSISQNHIFIIICILISLYFSIYYIPYNKRAIFITFTAIASDYFIQPTEGYVEICFYRLAFVALAAVITYIVLRYIYPINIEKSYKLLKENYQGLNKKIIKELKNEEFNESNYEILIINKLLWRRAVFINKYKKSEKIESLINEEEFIISEYNYFKRFIKNIDDKKNFGNELLEKIKEKDQLINQV